MKLSTVLILGLLAVIAWGFVTRGKWKMENGGSKKAGMPSATVQPVAAPNVAEKERQPELIYGPIADDKVGPLRQYIGVIDRHFSGGELLVRCGLGARPDSGPQGDYVLVQFPRSGTIADGKTIDFFARWSGTMSYVVKNDERRVLVRLAWEPTAPATPVKHPGDWMFKSRGNPLNQAPR